MDFIEGIGERYLLGKANAVPQQLENLAKKQLKGDETAAKAPSPDLNAQKDKEIERLRKQLAEAKLSEEQQAKKVPKSVGSVGGEGQKFKQRASSERAKSISGRSARSEPVKQSHGDTVKVKHRRKAEKEADGTPKRGRSDSIKTAIGARPHLAHYAHHEEAHKPQSTGGRSTDELAMTSPRDLPPAAARKFAVQGEEGQKMGQSLASEQPRPATDFCVVEVTEEDPQRRRRRRHSGANVVEVIEKDRHRTRYVVK
ncbi:MAG: hypothetical protein LQ338_007534 [Usnochroma carphineum]|nr:MAG: hypothetical protein LQ338_007534 [Usnochroma carphineum]